MPIIDLNLPLVDGFTRAIIPLDIPDAMVAQGAIQLYAMKFTKWTPTIKQVVDNVEVEVPNPQTAYAACVERIRGQVKADYANLLEYEGSKAGAAQARIAFDSAFANYPNV